MTPDVNLLVLDTGHGHGYRAPVAHDQFSKPGDFDQVSQNVGAYWKAHLYSNGAPLPA